MTPNLAPSEMNQHSPLGSHLLAAAIILIAVCVTYWRVVSGEFVVDDKVWAALPKVTGSWGSLTSLLTSWGFSETSLALKGPPLFRPLGSLILKLFHGNVGPNPFAFHLFSLCCHYLNSLLVFALLGALLPALPMLPRLLSALAFALHPAAVEAVAWISSIGELQMTTCVLLAMLCYLEWRRTGRKPWLAATAMLAFAGVMIKDGALVFVLLVLVHDWCRDRQIHWKAVASIGSGTLLYLVWRLLVVGSVAGGKPLNFAGDRLAGFVAAHLRYLFIPGQQPFSIAAPEVPLAGPLSLLMTGILLSLLMWWGRAQQEDVRETLKFGGAWILLTLWPAYAIALVEAGFFAGRHCYLPAVGWAILLGAVAAEATKKVPLLRYGMASGVVVMAALSSLAANSWRTEVDVYQRAVKLSPNDEGPLAGLADALFVTGANDRAKATYEQLMTRTPNPQSRCVYLYRLAIISSEQGQYAQSDAYLNEIIQFKPDDAAAWVGLGNNAWLSGQMTAALGHYRQAVKLEPGNLEAQRNMATLLKGSGQGSSPK